jgi:hypothetical protein
VEEAGGFFQDGDVVSGAGVEECIDKAEELASAAFDREAYVKRHQAWLARKIDCTAFLTWFIENYPESATQTRNADFSSGLNLGKGKRVENI